MRLHPTRLVATPQLLYAMVFRLNREPRSHTGRAIPALDPHGNYSILDGTRGWGYENPILRLGNRHCFFGVFDTEDVPPQLRKVHVGDRVRVVLQPTTPTPNGGLRLGTTYERHPRLMRADFHFRNSVARAAMRRIGCPAVPLGPPGRRSAAGRAGDVPSPGRCAGRRPAEGPAGGVRWAFPRQ
jgi:hypothetical protein